MLFLIINQWSKSIKMQTNNSHGSQLLQLMLKCQAWSEEEEASKLEGPFTLAIEMLAKMPVSHMREHAGFVSWL